MFKKNLNINIKCIPVKVFDGGHIYQLSVNENQNILAALVASDISYSAICGGTGRCGKCKIQVLQGELPCTEADIFTFSEEELGAGMRLACQAYPKGALTIALRFQEEKTYQAVTDYRGKVTEMVSLEVGSKLGIAIDIGTTTIAMQLLDIGQKKIVGTHTLVNRQRKWGADVISRIKAANEGRERELQTAIRNDLEEGIKCLLSESDVLKEQVKNVAIAGNTTMIHILMGYDCKGLGEYPFLPVNVSFIEDSYKNIMNSDLLLAKVSIFPGISAFVGGDIVSGIYHCDIDKTKEYSMLIDLGTNGEIVIGNCEKMIVTSTAAGPAFEGGNIKWGVGSVEGAISGVSISDESVSVETVGNKKPVGICGTGVVETVAELLREKHIDETGCLEGRYFDEGYPLARTETGEMITFTQQDVREIQLAKAAIKAGIETLLLKFGIDKEEISKVYLAGGFAYWLNYQKAIAIGMIPEEFSGKIEAVGNSSLGGAVKFLLDEKGKERLQNIKNISEEMNLAMDEKFHSLYMESMYF